MPRISKSFRMAALTGIVCVTAMIRPAATAQPPTVEELKARLSSTSIPDRPKLCVEIAERQLDASDKLFAATESDKAQAALTDVVAFAQLARDYSIQSHKHQKQTEIAVRKMARKLNDIKHVVVHADQAPVQEAIRELQRVSDDLLAAMFTKSDK